MRLTPDMRHLEEVVTHLCAQVPIPLSLVQSKSKAPLVVHTRRWLIWTLRQKPSIARFTPSYPDLALLLRGSRGRHSVIYKHHLLATLEPQYRSRPHPQTH